MPANPDLYREMSQPFANADEAEKALTGFFEELGELRKKHRIANAYTIIAVMVVGSDGEEGEVVTSGMYGDSLRAESLTAWAFGHESAQRQEKIAKLIAQGVSRGKKKK